MSSISTWSTTPANNNDTAPNGAPEGMAPSGVNDTIREIMARIREWYEDAQWIDLGLTHVRVSSSQFTIAGNYSTVYTVGRRVRMMNAGTAAYGTVSAVSYVAPDTTVTIAELTVPGTISSVAISVLTPDGSAIPTRFPAGPTDFTGGSMRITESATHSAGAGLELIFDSVTPVATLQAYDRTAGVARALRVNGSTFSVRCNGVEVGLFAAASSGNVLTLPGSLRISGAATLGATSTPGVWSFETPVLRQYLGDGTGYSFALATRAAGVTTDVATFNEFGGLTLTATNAGFGAILQLVDPSAAANNGRWRLRNVGEQLRVEAYNDADTAQAAAITVERTGAAIDSVAVSTKLALASHTTSSSASAGGASALPVTPTGYVTVAVNGSDKKIPYYD
jgi:hypothetical protein